MWIAEVFRLNEALINFVAPFHLKWKLNFNFYITNNLASQADVHILYFSINLNIHSQAPSFLQSNPQTYTTPSYMHIKYCSMNERLNCRCEVVAVGKLSSMLSYIQLIHCSNNSLSFWEMIFNEPFGWKWKKYNLIIIFETLSI